MHIIYCNQSFFEKLNGGDCMDILIAFIVAIAAGIVTGVACHYIIRQLDKKSRNNN